MKKLLMLLSSLFIMSMFSCKTASKASEKGVLTDRYWKLVELNGAPVANAENEPSLTLHTEGARLSGSAGCNRLLGTYDLTPDGRLSFGQVGATRMLCRDMAVEDAMLAMLSKVNGYVCKGDNMSLTQDGKVLAKFVAVAMH